MAPAHENLPAEFNWQAHPATERVGAALGAAATMVAAAAAIFVSFQSIAWSGLALAVLVLALNRFYFPSRFQIDSDGITARHPLRSQRFRWDDIRRFVVDARGGYLSTRSKRSWVDAHRGLHILFGSQREAVIEQIRAHLQQGAGS